jgi:hypothetical protein
MNIRTLALLVLAALVALACAAPVPRPTNQRKADDALQQKREKVIGEYQQRGVIRKIDGFTVYVGRPYRLLDLDHKKTLAQLCWAYLNRLPMNATKDDLWGEQTVYLKDASTGKRLASYSHDLDGFNSDE